MANNLQKFVLQNLASGLMVLRNQCPMLNSMVVKMESVPGAVSSTVDIPYVKPGVVGDVSPAAVPPNGSDSDTGSIQLVVDQWKKSDFFVTDKEFAELNEDYFRLRTEQACSDLADYVNASVWANYRQIYNAVGTPGTNPFASGIDVIGDANKVLSDNKTPNSGRSGILSTAAYYKATTNNIFAQAYSSNDPAVMRESVLGRKFGVDWYYDQQAPTHTAGTGTGYLVNGAATAGSSSVTVDTGSGTLVAGDLITFAGHTQQYTVVSFAAGVITFAPELKVAVADNAAVTRVASHTVNLIFHRDCMAFATRPLDEANSYHEKLGKITSQIRDEQSGLSLRLVISSQYNRTNWEYQILYGTKIIRPELGVRLMG